MREEKEVINAIEFLPVHVRRNGEVEHVLKTDWRLLSFAGSFADESGPHCVMKFRRGVAHGVFWLKEGAKLAATPIVARRKSPPFLHLNGFANRLISMVPRKYMLGTRQSCASYYHPHDNDSASQLYRP